MKIIPFSDQVITWFQNRRAKLKRDMEELKKDVETVKAISQKSFLENVHDLGILKKKASHQLEEHAQAMMSSQPKWGRKESLSTIAQGRKKTITTSELYIRRDAGNRCRLM